MLIARVALAMAAASATSHATEAECFEDWAVASEIVAREKLVGIQELQASLTPKGDVVRSLLCRNGGRYTYRVVVKSAGGELRRSEVEARMK